MTLSATKYEAGYVHHRPTRSKKKETRIEKKEPSTSELKNIFANAHFAGNYSHLLLPL